jgi:hypothetical protein
MTIDSEVQDEGSLAIRLEAALFSLFLFLFAKFEIPEDFVSCPAKHIGVLSLKGRCSPKTVMQRRCYVCKASNIPQTAIRRAYCWVSNRGRESSPSRYVTSLTVTTHQGYINLSVTNR